MVSPMRSLICAAAIMAALLPVSTFAQSASGRETGPMAQPILRSVPEPQDAAWPGGTIRLEIDATDTQRGVYRVTETIPVAKDTATLTLLFPQWLPGHHAPRGPIAELADLRFTADGKAVPWRRDPVEVHAFHLDLPAGTREIVAKFVHTSPLQPSEG